MRGNIDGGVGYGSAARLEQLHAHVGVMCLIPLPLHPHLVIVFWRRPCCVRTEVLRSLGSLVMISPPLNIVRRQQEFVI
ncbi:uncharacterized protein CC84DRAFT_577860 [Paraphaeosphaeria sporulosa]|uniref:Uncharacterized protein n=1 Tax=Paraphaeosphaeria sporulosa TaxID=1460663 RepID=A0A177CLM9_9PLEO|nr:uncharacterized protein CC84DRAFT_577860 [Paraphaeosphaeria sporulosa]OAG08454.1 hypothetical protein CC84DRAFT_577860 [Paraphaeosphaeria sporulosa]